MLIKEEDMQDAKNILATLKSSHFKDLSMPAIISINKAIDWYEKVLNDSEHSHVKANAKPVMNEASEM